MSGHQFIFRPRYITLAVAAFFADVLFHTGSAHAQSKIEDMVIKNVAAKSATRVIIVTRPDATALNGGHAFAHPPH